MIEPKRPKVSPAQSRRAYEKVAARSFGLCEGCGHRQATQMHHRQYRSRGGRDEVVNLIHVCGNGNNNDDSCHGRAHNDREAVADGWSVVSGVNPAHVPVLYRGRFVFLLPDGGIEDMGEVTF